MKPCNSALGQPLQKRLPALDWADHQSHAIGGANSPAMVVMFVDCCVGGRQYFLYYSYSSNPTGQEFFVLPGTLLSSLGNRTVAGIDRYDISSASFGIHFFIVKSMTYQFLYRLKNLYDYRWQQ
jgi:hypothetical protein